MPARVKVQQESLIVGLKELCGQEALIVRALGYKHGSLSDAQQQVAMPNWQMSLCAKLGAGVRSVIAYHYDLWFLSKDAFKIEKLDEVVCTRCIWLRRLTVAGCVGTLKLNELLGSSWAAERLVASQGLSSMEVFYLCGVHPVA
jgi:hypothetical protein